MAVRVTATRALPKTPFYSNEKDATWYEHEERMRPSYISQPGLAPAPCKASDYYHASALPPTSPSARWSAASYPQQQQRQQQQQQQQYPFPPLSPSAASKYRPSRSPPPPRLYAAGQHPQQWQQGQAAQTRPSSLNIPPSRPLSPPDPFHAFEYEGDNVRRTSYVKGSAFMVSLLLLLSRSARSYRAQLTKTSLLAQGLL
jgi:hypothetical protein